MSPETYTVVVSSIIVIMLAVVLIVNYVKRRKAGEDINPIEYLYQYSDMIKDMATQAIDIYDIKVENYESEELFKKDLIDKTIDVLLESAKNLDINTQILGLLNRDMLVDIVYKIIEGEINTLLKSNTKSIPEEDKTDKITNSNNTTDMLDTIGNFYDDKN